MSIVDLSTRVLRFADAREASERPCPTGIDGFTFVRSRRPTTIEPMLYRPLLCVVLQGRKESRLGDERVSFGAGQSLIVSLDLPSASCIVEASPEVPYVALALEIDLRIIRGLHEEVGEADLALDDVPAMIAGSADDALVDAMGRLFELVERPVERRVLLPLVLREIHFRMLLAGHGAMLRRLARWDSHTSRVARAIAAIRERFPETVAVADLARIAGMSASSFHEHFKTMTRTTPLQYQKDLRLLEARDRLMAGERSVSGVAYDVGYESPTQFSREYARKFGNPPRVDMAS